MFDRLNFSVKLSLLTCLLAFLTACNNQAAESLFAPDPKLKENSENVNSSQSSVDNVNSQTNQTQVELPNNFPENIPRYPKATLTNVEIDRAKERGKTNWKSVDSVQAIADFYQQELPSQGWKITQAFAAENNNDRTLTASRDRLEVKVSISPSTDSNNAAETTNFSIAYQTTQEVVNNNYQTDNTVDRTPQNQDKKTNQTNQTESFNDLENTPQQLSQYVKDLMLLGALTSENSNNKTNDSNFAPDRVISRRDFALWLMKANNLMYANVPSKQIRSASATSQPAFRDIAKNDPDFTTIQGLAEAGIIPSALTGDTSASLFRPDAPLTRESLLLWKMPLDLRKALPSATINDVKETWGFQDTNKIDPKILSSLLADHQNSDRSNIRRVFGFTTLFQPKKTVTRAEAAAAVWYFGYQGDGINAKEALEIGDQK